MLRANSQTCSVPETARALGFTTKYIYDLLYSSRIAARKVAGRWRIPKDEVEARLRKREQQ